MTDLRRVVLALVWVLCLPGAGVAEDEDLELARKSQNPIGNLISLPLENNLSGNSGSRDALEYDATLKPVYPVELTKDLLLINRAIASLIHVPGEVIPKLVNTQSNRMTTTYVSAASNGVLEHAHE